MPNQFPKSTDTSRSWRAMRLVICLIAAVGAAGSAFLAIRQETFNQYSAEFLREDDASSQAIKDEEDAQFAQANGKMDDAHQYHILADSERKFEVALKSQFAADEKAGIHNWFWAAAGLGILAGVGGWICAWLLIVAIAFVWWFILDRIREIARAIKGQH
jgi:hypothetical protein